mgnify:CR=1 FL=1
MKTWLAEKKQRGDSRPVFLTYFGADSPRYSGLEVTRFGDEMNDSGERFFPAQVRGGWFAISATYFHCTFLPMRGTWAEAHHWNPWLLGGLTDLDNGVLLCRHHHQRIHEEVYRAERLPNGDIRFHRRR